MVSTTLLLMLPSFVLANINVQLKGTFDGNNPSNLRVSWSGSEVATVTAEERNTFGIHFSNLRDGTAKYFGRQPDYFYVYSPTPPWGDIYKEFGWGQVKRTLVAKSGRVLSISSQPTVVVEQVFENNSSYPTTFKTEIQQNVQNTVTSSWSKGGELNVGQDIHYGFDIDVLNIGGSISFSYTSSWGNSVQQSQAITIGSVSGMEIKLQPQEVVHAKLLATRGTVKLEIEYEASLSGGVAVKFVKKFKNHHFWLTSVQSVLNKLNLPNKKTSREVIEIGFYTQSRVVVEDVKKK